jgi:uroporphyrinogen-III synthase
MEEIRKTQPKDILCLKEIDKEQRNLALEMGLKLHDIEVLNLVPTSFKIEVADIAIVASFFGAEQLKNRLSKMPKKMWVVGQKATDSLINSGYSGKITTYRNSDDLVKAFKEKQPGTAVYYGAERTSQDWVKSGVRHIITYRNSAKPPRLARQKWDAICVFSPLGAESALAENEFYKNTPVVCIGKRTTEAFKKRDFTKVVASPQPDFTALLQTLKNELS